MEWSRFRMVLSFVPFYFQSSFLNGKTCLDHNKRKFFLCIIKGSRLVLPFKNWTGNRMVITIWFPDRNCVQKIWISDSPEFECSLYFSLQRPDIFSLQELWLCFTEIAARFVFFSSRLFHFGVTFGTIKREIWDSVKFTACIATRPEKD